MKYPKFLLLALLCLFSNVSISQRSDEPWWIRMNDPNEDFLDLIAEADSYILDVDTHLLQKLPMSLKEYAHWRNYWIPRLDDDGTRMGAVEALWNSFTNVETCNNGANWTQMGPFEPAAGNSSGKGTGYIQEAWINPLDMDEIFIGADQGGLFKTTDGGQNWTNLFANRIVPSTQVQALEVNPNNTDEIYVSVGTAGHGIGLLYSDDGGQTWEPTDLTKAPLTNYSRGISRKIKVDPGDYSYAYAFTPDNVYKTEDNFEEADAILTDNDLQPEGSWIDMSMNASDYVFISSNKAQLFRYEHYNSSAVAIDISNNLITNQVNAVSHDRPLLATAADRSDYIYVLLHYREDNGSNDTAEFPHRISLQRSVNNGDDFAVMADFESPDPRLEFACSLVDTNAFYIAGRTTGMRIEHDGNNYILIDHWSNSGTVGNANFMHADVRDIDVIEDGSGGEVVYWSNDGSLSKSVGQVFENLTAQNINLWMNHDFLDVDASGEIYTGVYHGGNHIRRRDGEWRIRMTSDGGDWAIGDGNREAVVGGSNQYFYKFNRNMGDDGHVDVPSGTSWWQMVSFPIATIYGTDDQFYAGYNKLFIYDWSDHEWIDSVAFPNDKKIWNITTSEHHDGLVVLSRQSVLLNELTSLYKSDDYGVTWSDIGDIDALDGVTNQVDRIANAIFIDPNDPDKIWLGLSGISDNKKVIMTTNGGDDWYDMTAGDLGVYPVNDFAHDEITNILYCSTDQGVYYLDLSDSNDEWSCFFSGLPTGHVVQIDVNYCEKKLIASSYGRGLWKSDLINVSAHNSAVVSTTLDHDIAYGEELHPSAHLNIDGDVTVSGRIYMNEDMHIYVMPGSKLTVDGGILTNSCGGLWGGVVAPGRHHFQNPGSRPYSQSVESDHGVVVLKNGAQIELAHVGVELGMEGVAFFDGGILYAEDAEFRNNEISVRFLEYSNYATTYPFGEIDNVSYIENCEFITDGALPDPQVEEPLSQIDMHAVRGISIKACTFEDVTDWASSDRSNSVGKYRRAIRSWDASYKLDPTCNVPLPQQYISPCWGVAGADSNVFKGYTVAIEASNLNSVAPVTIRGAAFRNNRCNAILNGTDMAEIYRNTFKSSVPSGVPSLGGVYLINSTGYTLEENEFLAEPNFPHTGLYVTNSGNDDNVVRNNYFENFGYAAATITGDNDGPEPYDGLEFLCNDMNASNRDVYVSGGDVARYQGSCPSFGNVDNSLPANCDFSSSCVGTSNYTVSGSSQDIIYNHLTGEDPDCHSSVVIPHDCDVVYDAQNGERCPNNELLYPSSSSVVISDFMDEILVNEETLRVAGDDIELMILNDDPDLDIKSEILSNLPFIRESVLEHAISLKPTDMNDAILLEILEANAPLSEDVMSLLNTHYPQLVTDVEDHVSSNGLVVSPLQELELQLNSLERKIKRLKEESLRYWLAYDSIGIGEDSIIDFLERQESSYFLMKEIRMAYKLGNSSEVPDLIRDLDENEVSPDFYDWMDIMDTISNDSMGVFAIAENENLESNVRALASVNKSSMESANARAMLNLVFGEALEIPDLPTEQAEKSESLEETFYNEFSEVGETNLIIYPNPANDRVIIEYYVPEGVEKIQLELYSMTGRNLGIYQMNPKEQQKEMDVSQLSQGVYVYLLTVDGKLIARRKLMIGE